MRLWKVFDGEPFMINPRLGILNPKRGRKKGKKAMARRRSRGKAHMAWVRSFRKRGRKAAPRRRRRLRNPYPVAGLAINPRRRRRRGRSNPRRRSYRRNPSVMGIGLGGLPPLQAVAFTGVGFVGTPMAEGFLNTFLPVSLTGNTIGKYAVRIGSVLGLSMLAKAVLGRSASRYVALGGGLYVAVTAVKEFAPGLIPGMSAYVVPNSMGAYVSSSGRNFTQLGAAPAPRYGAPGNVVQARFRRF